MIEFLDGFMYHEKLVQATIARMDAKVNLIKKESHTSHCNQAFDQLLVKNDKKVAAETLAEQKNLLIFGKKATALNQWDLVLTGISIVNKTTPEMWINSFTRVNMHTLTRIKFSYWTEKIKALLISGSIFKNFNSQPTVLEKFYLLPQFCWGMSLK